ncbi:hypothetical protein AB1Y20_003210 [Prymnesium parvum]|uniref:Uncharacterized protein n=1 Tax=Prymnesium parvum TaxID=97485 RepID=A0AB34JAW9_PRYPA
MADTSLAGVSGNAASRFFAEAVRTEPLPPMTAALREGRVHFPPNTWAEDCLFYLRNKHVLLSVFLAHPHHPFPRHRRALVLANSLAFAFFVTCVMRELLGKQGAAQGLALFVSAVLQIAWDVPGVMFGACACATATALPVWLRQCCGCASLLCLSCHLLMGAVYALVGLILLAVLPGDELKLYDDFAAAKLLSFALAVPVDVAVFAMLHYFESRSGLAEKPESVGQHIVLAGRTGMV